MSIWGEVKRAHCNRNFKKQGNIWWDIMHVRRTETRWYDQVNHNKRERISFLHVLARQIKSIFHFWCCDTEASVLGIDTTFNLCELWITDSCYKNGRLVHNATGDHPAYLGPLLFHFTKEEFTFTRFALEMVGLNPEITNVRLVQIWMRQFTTVWKQLLLMIVNYIWYDTLANRMKNLINY